MLESLKEQLGLFQAATTGNSSHKRSLNIPVQNIISMTIGISFFRNTLAVFYSAFSDLVTGERSHFI